MSSFSINSVVLAGNVTKDAELKYTKNETPVLKFGLATNESIKKGEEWVNIPTFHDIVVWGKLGQMVADKLLKGVSCTVMGKISKRSWEYEGKKHYATEVVADKVIVSGRSERTPQGETAVKQEDVEQASGGTSSEDIASDVPF